MNPALVQQQIQLPYSRDTWRPVLRELLPNLEFFAQVVHSPLTNEREREIATARRQFGRATLADGKIVALYEIDVVPAGVDLLRSRVALRQLIARCIDQVSAHAVLAFFVQSGTVAYRLTYAARESTFDMETLALETRETATRRFTYVLGPGETRRTAAVRLAGLAEKRAVATLTDVTNAFSVELLNDEFFDTYRTHYGLFCEHLLAGDAPTRVFGLALDGLEGKALDRALKPVRDFVKKLLGRLVFLHFLQKKGWLGCPALPPTQEILPQESVPWTGGQPDFLRGLFNAAPAAEQDRFHSARLVPLFFDTLNDPRRPGHRYAVTGTRVPYLNGGLFERDFAGVEHLDFPAALFRDLLDFFGQYHFTIDENDPEDHEIGIDPEMLGHIFENLLEDNKDKGTYYTPKPVVQYMAQQSLVHALAARFPDDPAARAEIEALIRRKEPIDTRQADAWLTRHATRLAEILDRLKICDPAIGSGAFPVGLLQEIYWTRLTLNPALDRAAAKRAIIQRSIHGVDLDAGAVEIARLRFWLALIVDEPAPVPLPNLDYQIMQGNSLLESFEGERLDTLAEPVRYGEQRFGSSELELALGGGEVPARTLEFRTPEQSNLAELQSRYFVCHEPEAKARLRAEIDSAVLRAIDARLTLRREELEASLRSRAAFTGRAHVRGEEKKRVAMQVELETLSGKSERLHALLSDPRAERPFFLWHLWFREIFERNGGFDIVIANPPYGADISENSAPFLRAEYSTVANSLDSFIMFVELATKHLRENGCLSFIIPSGWASTPSCRKLRALFTRSYKPNLFATLPYDVFGEAYVDTMIIDATRLRHNVNWDSLEDKTIPLTVFPVRYKITELADFERYKKVGNISLWDNPEENGFLALASADEAALVSKLRRQPRHFDDYVEVMRGIETFNPVSIHSFANPRTAFSGDIYRYQVTAGAEVYVDYPPTIEAGKPWKFFSGPRILLRQLLSRKFRLQACYVEANFLTNQSVQSLVSGRGTTINLKTLLAFLNSQVISWLFCQINLVARRDDFPKTIIKQTRELPLPDLDNSLVSNDSAVLPGLVDQILTAKRTGDAATVAKLEAEIDTHVYRLYGLTPEEVQLVRDNEP